MHLVIDNQAPFARVKKTEVREFVLLRFAMGQHLIRRDCNGPNVFRRAGVFADLIFSQGRLVEQLVHPLAHGCRVRGEHKCRCTNLGNRRHSNDGFSSATGKHDHSAASVDGATGVKSARGIDLVRPQRKGSAITHLLCKLNF